MDSVKQLLKKAIPAPLRKVLRGTQHALTRGVQSGRTWGSENVEVLLGRRDKLVPPERLRHLVGGGDYIQIGEEFLRYFVEFGELTPDARVLDVGCSIGRMAGPLTRYLGKHGSYEGFDIEPVGIEWCKKNITRRFPNFRFHLADVFNRVYNPRGSHRAGEYRFPYEDCSFDLVYLVSVFTHMLPQDVGHYLAEVARVLRRGRRCLITFFLLNDESLKLVERGESLLDFKLQDEGYATIAPEAPERAIAYHQAHVQELYHHCGLSIVEPIHYGFWCQRKQALSYQDLVVAVKT